MSEYLIRIRDTGFGDRPLYSLLYELGNRLLRTGQTGEYSGSGWEASVEQAGACPSVEVSPCPFCNEYYGLSGVTEEPGPENPGDKGSTSILCLNCNAIGPSADTREQAQKLWNQRWQDL